jgi:hypothetical protein
MSYFCDNSNRLDNTLHAFIKNYIQSYSDVKYFLKNQAHIFYIYFLYLNFIYNIVGCVPVTINKALKTVILWERYYVYF